MARRDLQRLIPGAPAALYDMLDDARGALLPPIRSEIFGPQRFAQHGRSLAATHRAAAASARSATFFPRLDDNIRVLREAHSFIGLQTGTGYDISPAGEWLLDNFHLIEAQLKEIHDSLPRAYFLKLPVLLDEPLEGLPRVYGVAWAFVAHTDSAFDKDLLMEFLGAYQQARGLNLGEAWALPTTLRVVLIENLRRLAERVAANKAAREVANLCCDRVGEHDLPTLDALHELLERRGVGQAFLAQMAHRQHAPRDSDDGHRHGVRAAWLTSASPDLSAMQVQQIADQTANNLSVSNAVTALRAIGDADWPDIVAHSSVLMQRMLSSEVFAAEDMASRDQTLHAIERLARRSGRAEVAVADTLLGLMRQGTVTEGEGGHPPDRSAATHWLLGEGRSALFAALGLRGPLPAWRAMAQRGVLPAYLAALLLGSVALVAWMLLHGHPIDNASSTPVWLTLVGALLMLFPATETVVAVINRLVSESTPPQHLPRLALAEGIPPAHRVMVVIPALLTSVDTAQALGHRLLLHYLANPEPCAQFALLTDGPDADSVRRDDDAALLNAARGQIQELNRRHPGAQGSAPRFILLHRERLFSETEQRWIGWERKRGKLEQLVAALATGSSAAFVDLGADSSIAADTRYIVTLDSDTELPPGRLRQLVGVAAHPHNQPRLDAGARAIVSGYGILQPRLATPLPTPREMTPFHWLFAGERGIDPYSAASSEVYQDLFGEGSFTGKGLLHVHAVHAVLAGRLPVGQVLSHDLLEGAMARCAAVTDLTLIEDAPSHADVAASRQHRWTRGDWQLLPILLQPQLYPLRVIHRWKMVDNLRRSLVAPMSLALLVMALAGVGVGPWAALALVLAAYAAGPLIGALAGLLPSRSDVAKLHFYRLAALDLLRAAGGGLWQLALLPRHALLAADAIARAIYRMGISRRLLLQWTTAAAAQAAARSGLTALLRAHWRLPLLALALGLLLWALATPHPLLALALCAIWAASPVFIWWVSTAAPPHPAASVSAAQRDYLETIARDSWRLFERCVGPEDHHLPPDNLQTVPHDMVAHRTSPTNIGLYLLSAACARQFGWIGTQDLLARLEATLATLQQLRRHRGHLLNWYDTQTLAALPPMYLSTVDSGNFCTHLLALAQALRELARAPFDPRAGVAAITASRRRLTPLLARRRQLTPAQREGLRWCLADHRQTLRSAAEDGRAATAPPATADAAAGQRLLRLAGAFEQMAGEADFGFLHHPQRRLLHIGYRVEEQQFDAGFYDQLASESRLTSLWAVAKGDVPVQHWAALGRPFFAVGARAGLRSWSGSMFEYLMPSLVLHEPPGSVLQQAVGAAVSEQIKFARARDVPWGISESAYAGRDHTLAYQYAPQGVPRLALRRTPSDELVVAPYATALAAQVVPEHACQNFAALEKLGARTRYGFVEALDFTPARQVEGAAFTSVHTFMAHHQGMSIVAMANVLLDGLPRRWGMAHPAIEAVASLLHERVPRQVSLLGAPPPAIPALAVQRLGPALHSEHWPGTAALEPTHVLSNGRYSVSLRANGAGASRWGTRGVTRWRDDALRDALGSFFYLRADAQAPLVSITQHPAPDEAAAYRCVFHADRVSFSARWPGLQAHTTVWVSPEDDIEFRRVELRNLSEQVLELELISAFEPTLAEYSADESHPAFSNLFVSAQWLAAHQALILQRKPRLADEPGMQVAHFLARTDPRVHSLRWQTDRLHWAGRNRHASQPLAMFVPEVGGLPASGALPLDTGLDPVCALSLRLRIEPNGKAEVTFATAAAEEGDTLRAVVDKYRQPSHVARASLMSATAAGIRLRALGISAEKFAAIPWLTTALVFSLSRPQGVPARAGGSFDGVCDRRALWRFGISGDRPILLVSASAAQGAAMLRSLAQALSLWSWGGIGCDLVVLNAEPASYAMPLQRELMSLRDQHVEQHGAAVGTQGCAFHVLRADEVSAAELAALQVHARIWLHADGRPLLHHLREWLAAHEQAHGRRQASTISAPAVAQGPTAAVPASTGEFAATSGAFSFDVGAKQRPPRPWINVLANPGFGCQVSEAGGGTTWACNSRSMKLSAWSNDPLADPPGEWILLQDTRTSQVWSANACALGDDSVVYRVSHAPGGSEVRHRRGDVAVVLSWCVDAQAAVKQVRLRLTNHGARAQQLRVVGIVEWLMGVHRVDRRTTRTACHRQALEREGETRSQLTTLLCTQREGSEGFGAGTAFLALAEPQAERETEQGAADWTCDRREMFDRCGRLVLPDHFGQQAGDGLDPCAALTCRVVLAPGASVERVFLVGYAANAQAAQVLAAAAAAVPAKQRDALAQAPWRQLLDRCHVTTPDPLFDVMVNHWLLYQAVACRMWAKGAFYQAGGATGYRDQLQDSMALAWSAPALLRAQIVLCASRQFAAGDVQHWWHAPSGAGVRTHFSDDLLWLPHACAHYLQATGDLALLDEAVPFIEGPQVEPGAEDAYFTPTVSAELASVYEHCARAIDHSLRVGAHGLPLMGSGDWNDGMNRVGHGGRGESVWLGWFLCQLVASFAPLADARGDTRRAERWRQAALGWTAALRGPGWDGQWFKRAFFDDGQPLGSKVNTEGRIDLIAQAWAVLSDAAPPAMQRMALAAVEAHLVDPAAGLIRLLDPPLVAAQPSAGYIQAYPPGVRENGGQYAHGAVWALMAQAQASLTQPWPECADTGDRVYRYFTYLSPAHRARHATRGPVYGLEPYAMAGDVYSQPPYVGRGGWSWYTGAAGWLHRAAIGSMFGLQQGADELSFTPCLPAQWQRVEMVLRRDDRVMRFILMRAAPAAALAATAAAGAQLLLPGHALRWRELAAQSCFVVPLAAAPTAPVAGAAARVSTEGDPC